MKQTTTVLLFSTLLLFLFGYTAFSKLMDPEGFKAALLRNPLTRPGAALLAMAIPLAELCLVLLLFFPATRLTGLYAAAGLLTVFTLYLVGMLLFAPHLPCQCGGILSGMGWWAHVGLNTVLTGLIALCLRRWKPLPD